MSHGMGETHRMPKDQQQEFELATLAAAALSGMLAGNPACDSKPLDPSNAVAKEIAERAWQWAVLMYRARPAVSKVLP